MRVFRRVVLPVVWVLLFSVVAAALVKIAFIDGAKGKSAESVDQPVMEAPVVAVSKTTIVNKIDLKGSVGVDAAVPVKNTSAGEIVYLYVSNGEKVGLNTPLYQVRQVRTQENPQASDSTPSGTGPTDGGKEAPSKEAPSKDSPAVQYDYFDVLSPATGTLNLTVLLNQQVAVGDSTGSVDPGTYSVSGTLTTAQRFRLLDRPTTASVAIVDGPAPFDCGALNFSSATSTANVSGGAPAGARSVPVPLAQAGPGVAGGSSDSAQGDAAAGQVTCKVPTGQKVFPGLGATMTLNAGQAKDAISVPVTSVKGLTGAGTVWVKSATVNSAGTPANGEANPGTDIASSPEAGPVAGQIPGFTQRKVKLGLTDGTRVQILEGLKDGENVLQFIPGLPDPQNGQPMGG